MQPNNLSSNQSAGGVWRSGPAVLGSMGLIIEWRNDDGQDLIRKSSCSHLKMFITSSEHDCLPPVQSLFSDDLFAGWGEDSSKGNTLESDRDQKPTSSNGPSKQDDLHSFQTSWLLVIT
jgi:hypothetical protein